MSTTSSQICGLKDFELMDNFVFRCYHARGQTDSLNKVIAKQRLLPNENHPSGSCNSKMDFIPLSHTVHIDDFAMVVFRK